MSKLNNTQIYILSLINFKICFNGKIDKIANMISSKKDVDIAKKQLESVGISTREEYFDFYNTEHKFYQNEEYKNFCAFYLALNDDLLDSYLDSLQKDKSNKIKTLIKYSKRADHNNILAFEHVSEIMMSFYAFIQGLITESEAWEHALSIAKKCQSTFKTWHDFAFSFLLGCSFYAENTIDNYRDFCHIFFTSKKSTYIKLDWNTELAL